jgi:hypothetical protein
LRLVQPWYIWRRYYRDIITLLPDRCWYQAGNDTRLVLRQVIPIWLVLWYQEHTCLYNKVPSWYPTNSGFTIIHLLSTNFLIFCSKWAMNTRYLLCHSKMVVHIGNFFFSFFLSRPNHPYQTFWRKGLRGKLSQKVMKHASKYDLFTFTLWKPSITFQSHILDPHLGIGSFPHRIMPSRWKILFCTNPNTTDLCISVHKWDCI